MRSLMFATLLAGAAAFDETALLQQTVQKTQQDGDEGELGEHVLGKEYTDYEVQIRKSDLSEEAIQELLKERKQKVWGTWSGDKGLLPKHNTEMTSCRLHACGQNSVGVAESKAKTCTVGADSNCESTCCQKIPDFYRYDGFFLPAGHDIVGADLHLISTDLHLQDGMSSDNQEMADFLDSKFQLLTVKEAMGKCTSSSYCRGFSHEEAAPSDDEQVWITFKSNDEMFATVPGRTQWTTYLMKEADNKELINTVVKAQALSAVPKHISKQLLGQDVKDMDVFVRYENARKALDRKKLEAAEADLLAAGHMVPPREGLVFPAEEAAKKRAERLQKFSQNVQKVGSTVGKLGGAFVANQFFKKPVAAEPVVAAQNAVEEGAPLAGEIPTEELAAAKPAAPWFTGGRQIKAMKERNQQLVQGQAQLTETLAKMSQLIEDMSAPKVEALSSFDSRNLMETEASRDQKPKRAEITDEEDQWTSE